MNGTIEMGMGMGKKMRMKGKGTGMKKTYDQTARNCVGTAAVVIVVVESGVVVLGCEPFPCYHMRQQPAFVVTVMVPVSIE